MELLGYRHGKFTDVWFQLELNCRRRFNKGAVPAPITVMAPTKLPGEERPGFYGSGPAVPTAIIPTMLPLARGRTHGVKPGAALIVAKDGSDQRCLCRPGGKKLSRTRADAKVYQGMVIEFVGFLPDFQASECNQVQGLPARTKGPATRWVKSLATKQPPR